MNILIFVISLMMMLALLTYGRLDMYRSFIVTQGEFERYMSNHERRAMLAGANQWYDWTALSTKNGGKKNSSPKDASPYLNLYWLVHPEARAINPTLDPIYRELLKKVIYIVFGNQDFFKNDLDKNPNLVDDLIQAIENAGNQLAQEKKGLKTIDELENLDLNNLHLQDAYYHLIKGYHIAKTHPNPSISLGNSEEEDEEEEPLQEYVKQDDEISLLQFVDLNPNKIKIRVYLAPKEILLALFGDVHTVDEIMQTRIGLFHQLKSEENNKNSSEQFKQKFASRAINIPENMLDFTVTGTNPRKYEVQ